ncbi:MAG: hypothetical protein V7L20_24770 [Nostoc sp.]|uniref:hypothetical protein n=1 Tax=Nostoc sp. TaxID=1180 RepID=UPI002FF7E487
MEYHREFISFENFTRLGEDGRVWITLRNTAEDEAGAWGIGYSPCLSHPPHSHHFLIPHPQYLMPHSQCPIP